MEGGITDAWPLFIGEEVLFANTKDVRIRDFTSIYLCIFQGLREGARTEDIAETSSYHTNPFIVTAEKQTGSIIYKQLLAASFYVEIDKTEATRRISSNSQVQIIHLYLGTKICLLPLIAISIWTLKRASAMQVLALHFKSFSMASYLLYSRASSSSRAPFSWGYLLSVQKLLSSFDDKRLTKNTLKGVKGCLARPKRFWPSLHTWGHCQYSAFV